MFCPPPEEESQVINIVPKKNRNRKRKKKSARKNLQHGVGRNRKKNNKLALTMSSWAENFTFAATWQLKHQLAFWKARAKALEYENKLLHDIIRKRNYVDSAAECSKQFEAESSTQPESNSDESDEGGEEFEVSEEFIQFLQANAKYKEEAREERERLKAQNSEASVIEQMEAGPSGIIENRDEVLKELYGDKWQRISALEMALQTQFIDESDKDKPMYWPNIPFNFNFG